LVDQANDGQEALELTKQNEYKLILKDMEMPNLNGIEATHAIRLLPDRQQTPIVALTGNAFGEDRQRCIDAGMNDYIIKPIESIIFYETLLKWLV
jgi:two-component system, sensor histidine kinase and response regulator